MTTLQHDTTTAAKTALAGWMPPGDDRDEILSTYDQLDPARQDKLAGACLRAMREAVGMTSRVMAEEVGCSRGHLGRIESGQRSLTEDLASRFARAIANHLTAATA